MNRFFRGRPGRLGAGWVGIGMLLFFFFRLLQTSAQAAATFDEPLHLLGSAVYWQHRPLLPIIDNPLLIHALIGLPLRLLDPVLPVDHPFWGERFATLALSTEFLWGTNENGLLMVWVGRWVVILIAMLLAALTMRWSGRLGSSRVAALVTLFLFTFDPNILAHAHLATTDIGTAFFAVLAAYLFWRYWQDPGRKAYLLTGIALGLALSSKYSAMALFLAVGFMGLLVAWAERPGWGAFWRAVRETAGWVVMAVFVLLAVQQFNLPVLLTNLEAVRGAGQFGHPTYLLGQIQQGGRWYYFPVIFLTKTPVPILVLIGVALVRWGLTGDRGRETGDRGRETGDGGPGTADGGRRTADGRRGRGDEGPETGDRRREIADGGRRMAGGRWRLWWFWPVLVAGCWVGVAMVGQIQVGYRQLLPVLPLVYVVLGQLARPGMLPGKFWRVVYGLSLGAFALVSLVAHPHYLAYFNCLAGGPENGWRIAVDSNLDWGQDLLALAGETAQPFYTALLSTTPPEAYQVPAEPIPVWPIPEPEPAEATFYPPRPGAGRYAVSATQLVGLYLDDPDTFAYFREQEPAGRAGYSIFLYDVPPAGPLTGLALSGVGLPEISQAVYEATIDSNQLALRWYDARESFIWPEAEKHWAAVADDYRPEHPLLAGLYPVPDQTVETTRPEDESFTYELYTWSENPLSNVDLQPPPFPADFRDADTGRMLLTFQGFTPTQLIPGEPLSLLTAWQVVEPPTHPIQLFMHLVNEQGEIIAQDDGWGVSLNGLQAGDVAAQLHQIDVPAGLPAGIYSLRLGVYEPESGNRLTIDTPTGTVEFVHLLPAFAVDSD